MPPDTSGDFGGFDTSGLDFGGGGGLTDYFMGGGGGGFDPLAGTGGDLSQTIGSLGLNPLDYGLPFSSSSLNDYGYTPPSTGLGDLGDLSGLTNAGYDPAAIDQLLGIDPNQPGIDQNLLNVLQGIGNPVFFPTTGGGAKPGAGGAGTSGGGGSKSSGGQKAAGALGTAGGILGLLAALKQAQLQQDAFNLNKQAVQQQLASEGLQSQIMQQRAGTQQGWLQGLDPLLQQYLSQGSPILQRIQAASAGNTARQFDQARGQLSQGLQQSGYGYAPSGLGAAGYGQLASNQAATQSENFLKNMLNNENMRFQAAGLNNQRAQILNPGDFALRRFQTPIVQPPAASPVPGAVSSLGDVLGSSLGNLLPSIFGSGSTGDTSNTAPATDTSGQSNTGSSFINTNYLNSLFPTTPSPTIGAQQPGYMPSAQPGTIGAGTQGYSDLMGQ